MNNDASINKSRTRLRNVSIFYILGILIFTTSCLYMKFSLRGEIIVPIITYLTIGFFLTKKFLPKLISFHPVWNTIDNLVSVKLRAIFLWPFFYFFLLIKLGFLHLMK